MLGSMYGCTLLLVFAGFDPSRSAGQPLDNLSSVSVSLLLVSHGYTLKGDWSSRFYPNGEVLSLLANEEVTPQQIIHQLKPSLRMKVR
jgi:hypothetical protein